MNVPNFVAALVPGRRTGTPSPAAVPAPALYPGIAPEELCRFLSEEDYLYIRAMRIVRIAPLYDDSSNEIEKFFGIGLAQLLIRDLRLCRTISVVGPEDSNRPLQLLDRTSPDLKGSIIVGGSVSWTATHYHGTYLLLGDEGGGAVDVASEDLNTFIHQSAEAILQSMGLEVDDTLRHQWETGRPASVEDLIAVGRFADSADDASPETAASIAGEATAFFRTNPAFPLPLHSQDPTLEDLRAALGADPYDVQILFLLHNKLCSGKGASPEAFQYLRRAIELAPGHGKAHMVVPLSSAPVPEVAWHSELGYRLLPGNGFAIGNYVGTLLEHNIVPPDLSVAYEGSRCDPHNPLAYWPGIRLLVRAGRNQEALALALKLKKILTPPLSQRTMYSLLQNPGVAAKLKAGKFNPTAEIDQEIERLRGKTS